MNNTGIKPKVIEEIRTFARKYNTIPPIIELIINFPINFIGNVNIFKNTISIFIFNYLHAILL